MPRETDFISLLPEPDLLQLMPVACPDGVVATDRDNRIILYTGASEAIFGFSPVEVTNRDLGLLFAGREGYQVVTEQLAKDGTLANLLNVTSRAPRWYATLPEVEQSVEDDLTDARQDGA